MMFLRLLCFGLLLPVVNAEDDGGYCIGTHCVTSKNSGVGDMVVGRIHPNCGPVTGTTEVTVYGQGFRNFGSLMRCAFGSNKVQAKISTAFGQYFNPFNNTMLICEVPPQAQSTSEVVPVEISLNGEDYTSNGVKYTYYQNPEISRLSPASGTTLGAETLTVSRNSSSGSGPWKPGEHAHGNLTCRFKTVVKPDGKRQVTVSLVSQASYVDETEIKCNSPGVGFTGDVHVEVSLNGQDFTDNKNIFAYADNWHQPKYSGWPPSAREGATFTVIGSDIFVFGGWDSNFLQDLWVLHTDVIDVFYPSDTAYDLAWEALTSTSSGAFPGVRSAHSTTALGNTLFVFGGLSSYTGLSYNDTFLFDTTHQVWTHPAVAGGPILPRSAHATVMSRGDMWVFGGWGLVNCNQPRPCYRYLDDLWRLYVNNMTWMEVKTVGQPLPRKGHSLTVVNNTKLMLFGGAVFMPDPTIQTTYQASSKHANDLFMVNVLHDGEVTWEEPITVGAPPPPRERHTATLLKGRYLIIFGGYNSETGYLQDLYSLDTWASPMVWSKPILTGNYPGARYSHTAALIDDEIFVFAGTGQQYFNDLHLLDLNDNNLATPQ